MKERELREAANCALCHQPFGHAGLPMFYRVTIERHGVDLRAVRRQDGLAQFMGSSLLAQHMGDDRDMTQTLMEPATITVCEACSLTDTMVAMLAEIAGKEAERKKAASKEPS